MRSSFLSAVLLVGSSFFAHAALTELEQSVIVDTKEFHKNNHLEMLRDLMQFAYDRGSSKNEAEVRNGSINVRDRAVAVIKLLLGDGVGNLDDSKPVDKAKVMDESRKFRKQSTHVFDFLIYQNRLIRLEDPNELGYNADLTLKPASGIDLFNMALESMGGFDALKANQKHQLTWLIFFYLLADYDFLTKLSDLRNRPADDGWKDDFVKFMGDDDTWDGLVDGARQHAKNIITSDAFNIKKALDKYSPLYEAVWSDVEQYHALENVPRYSLPIGFYNPEVKGTPLDDILFPASAEREFKVNMPQIEGVAEREQKTYKKHVSLTSRMESKSNRPYGQHIKFYDVTLANPIGYENYGGGHCGYYSMMGGAKGRFNLDEDLGDDVHKLKAEWVAEEPRNFCFKGLSKKMSRPVYRYFIAKEAIRNVTKIDSVDTKDSLTKAWKKNEETNEKNIEEAKNKIEKAAVKIKELEDEITALQSDKEKNKDDIEDKNKKKEKLNNDLEKQEKKIKEGEQKKEDLDKESKDIEKFKGSRGTFRIAENGRKFDVAFKREDINPKDELLTYYKQEFATQFAEEYITKTSIWVENENMFFLASMINDMDYVDLNLNKAGQQSEGAPIFLDGKRVNFKLVKHFHSGPSLKAHLDLNKAKKFRLFSVLHTSGGGMVGNHYTHIIPQKIDIKKENVIWNDVALENATTKFSWINDLFQGKEYLDKMDDKKKLDHLLSMERYDYLKGEFEAFESNDKFTSAIDGYNKEISNIEKKYVESWASANKKLSEALGDILDKKQIESLQKIKEMKISKDAKNFQETLSKMLTGVKSLINEAFGLTRNAEDRKKAFNQAVGDERLLQVYEIYCDALENISKEADKDNKPEKDQLKKNSEETKQIFTDFKAIRKKLADGAGRINKIKEELGIPVDNPGNPQEIQKKLAEQIKDDQKKLYDLRHSMLEALKNNVDDVVQQIFKDQIV